jgi:hypothetical protein
MVYDTFYTAIGERSGRPYDRLWIEDSYGRLARNGFVAGTGFDASHRAGVGLVITPSTLGSYSVTPRGQRSVISLEQRGLSDALRARDVRVRICVKSIVVMPCLRLFHVAKSVDQVWSIEGTDIFTPEGRASLLTTRPRTFRTSPLRIKFDARPENIAFATEIIGNAKPAEVELSGDELMCVVAAQFLRAAGYIGGADNIWRR